VGKGRLTQAGVDVVIVAFNSGDTVGPAITAARASGPVNHVVVVDHGRDQSADVAVSFGATVVRNPLNPGFGAGQNRGRAATTSPYVLLLNPDARMRPGALEHGLQALEDTPEAALVQGTIINDRSGTAERSQGIELGWLHLWGRLLHLRALLSTRLGRFGATLVPVTRDHVARVSSRSGPVEALAATAILARREALEQVGGFDERFFLYGEDLDLCRRLRDKGWLLLALPVPWADHTSGASAASDWEREVAWWSGTMLYAARWWDTRAWRVGLAAAGCRATVLAVRHPRQARRVWSALVVRPRLLRR
jgi:N-acetylglucosaminyl-diphospho-decaprenol L-rhamnosyltransferase